MFKDKELWISLGLLFVAIAVSLDNFAGPSDTTDFLIGLTLGLSIVLNGVYIYTVLSRPSKKRAKLSSRGRRR
jgi:hypothetical protein